MRQAARFGRLRDMLDRHFAERTRRQGEDWLRDNRVRDDERRRMVRDDDAKCQQLATEYVRRTSSTSTSKTRLSRARTNGRKATRSGCSVGYSAVSRHSDAHSAQSMGRIEHLPESWLGFLGPQVRAAAAKEAERPSYENLPADGSEIQRVWPAPPPRRRRSARSWGAASAARPSAPEPGPASSRCR